MPNLIISVTGRAGDFAIQPKLRDVLRHSLVDAAESTGNRNLSFMGPRLLRVYEHLISRFAV